MFSNLILITPVSKPLFIIAMKTINLL